MYAPKGVGALFISSAAHVPVLVPLMHGGGQEKGKRAGTENVPYCVGLGAAARLFSDGDAQALRSLRNRCVW